MIYNIMHLELCNIYIYVYIYIFLGVDLTIVNYHDYGHFTSPVNDKKFFHFPIAHLL